MFWRCLTVSEVQTSARIRAGKSRVIYGATLWLNNNKDDIGAAIAAVRAVKETSASVILVLIYSDVSKASVMRRIVNEGFPLRTKVLKLVSIPVQIYMREPETQEPAEEETGCDLAILTHSIMQRHLGPYLHIHYGDKDVHMSLH
ncbi:uncharacterized protein V6R79_002306 [Siganus canaliculatus]